MESFIPAPLDIFEIFRRYCDVMSGSYACGNEGRSSTEELPNGRLSRDSLNQLLKLAESRSVIRMSIFEEIYKLMSRLDLLVNNAEFSRFYDFVFFICRENGQKNITVSRAVMAWRLVLAGRFPLLNDWCNYVEQNQRHNISEDTWRQLLAFSHCVKDNLEGYDPEGAWPILIDDFMDHMYRCRSYTGILNSFCKCGLLDGQQSLEVPPPGAGPSNFVGVKRKFHDNFGEQNQSLDVIASYNNVTCNESQSHSVDKRIYIEEYRCGANDCMEKQSSPSSCSPSQCHVEGCLSKGFAGLLSRRSRMRC